jgi:hypothetical protein
MVRTLLWMVDTLLPLACNLRDQIDAMIAKSLAYYDMNNDPVNVA